MANTSSAKKAIRSGDRKKLVNDTTRENYRAARVDLEKAISAGDKPKVLQDNLQKLYKVIDKAAKRSVNVFSQNKAARLKSRFARMANAK